MMFNHDAEFVTQAVGIDPEELVNLINDTTDPKTNNVITFINNLIEKYGKEKLFKMIAFIVISTLDNIEGDDFLKNYFYLLLYPDFNSLDKTSYLIESLVNFFERAEREVNPIFFPHILFYFLSTALLMQIDKTFKGGLNYETIRNYKQ